MNWNYPLELPVVEHREEILAAIRAHPVVVELHALNEPGELLLAEIRERVGLVATERLERAGLGSRRVLQTCPQGDGHTGCRRQVAAGGRHDGRS